MLTGAIILSGKDFRCVVDNIMRFVYDCIRGLTESYCQHNQGVSIGRIQGQRIGQNMLNRYPLSTFWKKEKRGDREIHEKITVNCIGDHELFVS